MPTQPQAFTKVASKVFILGEYGVLAGGPALVAVRTPCFELQVHASDSFSHPFHDDSPTGRLLAFAHKREPEFFGKQILVWRDPFEGRGGMGESTASFVAVAQWLSKMGILSGDSRALWHLYQKLAGGADPSVGLPPSGADLLAQAEGTWLLVGPTPQFVPFVEPRLASQLLVFSATHLPDRKVRTHEHLQKIDRELALKIRQQTADVMARAVSAIIKNDAPTFGAALGEFAEVLFNNDLEHPKSTEIRRELAGDRRVLGVKGCGALMADTLIVLLDSDAKVEQQKWAAQIEAQFGLQWIRGGSYV